MNDEIMVSVCCLVYNHEKYLRQCLDGFMMQKTNFKFEVLIHDDASTDGSADIIREYEAKYPDIIKPIYQTENQYSKGVKISWTYQYPRAKGRYIALCEGDDYWTDECKLQKQFDAMESTPEASFCTHFVRVYSEITKNEAVSFPNENDINEIWGGKLGTGIVSSEKLVPTFLKGRPFQTSSFFIRADIIKAVLPNIPEFIMVSSVGDTPLMMLAATYGDFMFLNEYMSVYRLGVENSWTSKRDNDDQFRLSMIPMWKKLLNSYDEFTNYKYTRYVKYQVLKHMSAPTYSVLQK